MGIPARREQLLSPVTPLVAFLEAEGIHTAYVVGNRDFVSDLRQRMPELKQQEEGAQAVILAYDTELTYEKLSRSALLLQKDATHPDLVCPSPEGPLPDVGSFLALYATATGRRPERIFGKPDATLLSGLLQRYAPENMLMVGDRLSTDKLLAENGPIAEKPGVPTFPDWSASRPWCWITWDCLTSRPQEAIVIKTSGSILRSRNPRYAYGPYFFLFRS